VDSPIRRALGDARLRVDDVHEVILAGGATRMPLLARHIAETFGREPKCSINPDEVVALGAAIQAGLHDRHESVADLVVTDVAPFTMGVEVCKDIGGKKMNGYFLPILHRNTTIPCSRAESVYTVEPNQRSVTVRVFQGDDRRVERNVELGELAVPDIPGGPAGQEVELRFTYDLNGILEVDATVTKTRKTSTLVITRHAGNLSQAALHAAVQAMQSLKLHPREDSRNRFLIRRAERVLADLPLVEREQLDGLLTVFEGALENQDPAEVERWAAVISEFLTRHDPDADERDDA
jgi:molecular chaperone HscC